MFQSAPGAMRRTNTVWATPLIYIDVSIRARRNAPDELALCVVGVIMRFVSIRARRNAPDEQRGLAQFARIAGVSIRARRNAPDELALCVVGVIMRFVSIRARRNAPDELITFTVLLTL